MMKVSALNKVLFRRAIHAASCYGQAVSFFSGYDFQNIGPAYRHHDSLKIMIAVRTFAEHVKAEIYFSIRESDHS